MFFNFPFGQQGQNHGPGPNIFFDTSGIDDDDSDFSYMNSGGGSDTDKDYYKILNTSS